MKEFVNKEAISKKTKKARPEETEEEREARKKKGRPSKQEKIDARRKIKIQRLKVSKQQVEQNLAAAQSSTKSVGLFDKKAHQEQKQHKVKRRKEYANFSSLDDQIARNKEIFEIVRKSGLKKLQHSL